MLGHTAKGIPNEEIEAQQNKYNEIAKKYAVAQES